MVDHVIHRKCAVALSLQYLCTCNLGSKGNLVWLSISKPCLPVGSHKEAAHKSWSTCGCSACHANGDCGIHMVCAVQDSKAWKWNSLLWRTFRSKSWRSPR